LGLENKNSLVSASIIFTHISNSRLIFTGVKGVVVAVAARARLDMGVTKE
jgi:hypothetical protein